MTTTTATKTLTTTQCKAIYAEALTAADAAWDAAIPQPMIVGESVSLFNDSIDYSKPTYFISEGVCGFGWVTITPARGKFVTYLKSIGVGSRGYYGGWQVWRPTNRSGQSYERNVAAARAFAEVLTKYGITAYGEGRLD